MFIWLFIERGGEGGVSGFKNQYFWWKKNLQIIIVLPHNNQTVGM